jgi:hypothetical protein
MRKTDHGLSQIQDIMRYAEFEFILWTEQDLSQKGRELQAAAVRSHVSKLQWSVRKRERIAAVTVENRNTWSLAWEGVPLETTIQPIQEEEDSAPPNIDRTQDQEVDEHPVQSPWHWTKGARTDAFNVVPAASGQQFELDMRRCFRYHAAFPLTAL